MSRVWSATVQRLGSQKEQKEHLGGAWLQAPALYIVADNPYQLGAACSAQPVGNYCPQLNLNHTTLAILLYGIKRPPASILADDHPSKAAGPPYKQWRGSPTKEWLRLRSRFQLRHARSWKCLVLLSLDVSVLRRQHLVR